MRSAGSAVSLDMWLPLPRTGSMELRVGAVLEFAGRSHECRQSDGDFGRWRPETGFARA
jgi:hypothetical protein